MTLVLHIVLGIVLGCVALVALGVAFAWQHRRAARRALREGVACNSVYDLDHRRL